MVLPSLADRAFLSPTKTLRPRDTSSSSAYATGSDGCVICPTDPISCPSCPPGHECNLTSLTCSSCPEYVCVAVHGSPGSRGSNTGGIIGGVVGGVAVVILVSVFLYYKLVYRKKHPRLADDVDESESQYDPETSGARFDDSTLSGEKSERPPNSRTQSSNSITKNHRLSSYESFMRPPGYNKRGATRAGARRNPAEAKAANRVYGDDDSTKRHSVATTISTTNASNILPIAYIPGVTIRPSKNNTRSIYSYDTDSVFSDMAGIDNASIVHGQTRSTATAVKSQPKLVNVAPIDEEDEGEDDGVVGWEKRNSVRMVNLPERSDSTIHEHDADSDSDVDSDIGEIHRATSVYRHGSQENVGRDDESGSFVLDIGHGK